MRLRKGRKKPDTVAGAPFPPAEEHSDGPSDRPPHDVPTADMTDETTSPAEEPDEEEEDT
jgi:hypothetical protein